MLEILNLKEFELNCKKCEEYNVSYEIVDNCIICLNCKENEEKILNSEYTKDDLVKGFLKKDKSSIKKIIEDSEFDIAVCKELKSLLEENQKYLVEDGLDVPGIYESKNKDLKNKYKSILSKLEGKYRLYDCDTSWSSGNYTVVRNCRVNDDLTSSQKMYEIESEYGVLRLKDCSNYADDDLGYIENLDYRITSTKEDLEEFKKEFLD